MIQMLQCVTNVCNAEAFWQSVEDATHLVLQQEPGADHERVHELILREWLAFACPAGHA